MYISYYCHHIHNVSVYFQVLWAEFTFITCKSPILDCYMLAHTLKSMSIIHWAYATCKSNALT